MRILIVTAHYPPDFVSGATLQVQRLGEAMAADGHDVDVISGAIARGLADGAVDEELTGGVRVHWLGTADRIEQDDDRNWRNEAATALVESVVERRRPDIVHAHALQTLGAGVLEPPRTAGVATLVTMHDFWWWCARLFLVDVDLRPCPLTVGSAACPCARSIEWRERRAAELASTLAGVDQILVPSRAMRDAVVALGVPHDRVAVDENDIDGATVARGPARPADGTVRFVYAGGDHPLKGRDVVLQAAARLARVDAWSLRAYGVRPAATPRLRRWRTRRHDPRVEKLPAYVPSEAARVFAAADVLLVPSIARESYSLVAREALASGLAVVTSDCLGPTEVVRDGWNGLVVPTGDPVALADAMHRLIDDPALLERLRANAAAAPPDVWSTRDHVAALVTRYARLLGRRRNDPELAQ